MIIGLKLTHDGAIAIIDNGKLLLSNEMEKYNNRPRYSPMTLSDLRDMPDGYVVVDGWKNGPLNFEGHKIELAPYHEFENDTLPLHRDIFSNKLLGCYTSYSHVTTHLVGAYAMSPFSKSKKPSYAIVMDGGVNPRLYHIDPKRDQPIYFMASLHELYGIIYGIMRYYWGPYKDDLFINHPVNPAEEHPPGQEHIFGGYEYPGKLMAYIGFGKVRQEIVREFHHLYNKIITHQSLGYNQTGHNEHEILRQLFPLANEYSDADVLASIHYALQEKIIGQAVYHIPKGNNLILVGGSFLNIKWNAAFRDSKNFKQVFVPPVTNDTGNAIGAAVCEQIYQTDNWHLSWEVTSGPSMTPNANVTKGWDVTEVEPSDVAILLRDNFPVMFLNGNADIGPRSLGSRSIIMSAEHKTNGLFLNKIKRREDWRPVAPICLEQYADLVFSPGGPEPYMLFEHTVRDEWKHRIPAVVHVDGTARLQTLSKNDPHEELFCVLSHYYYLTSVPVLCNTSANLPGRGFFADLNSAISWATEKGIAHIYSNGYLYSNEDV